ncbi:hypothetical protein BgiBS90_037244, partial [Biomphalaria glabrata]
ACLHSINILTSSNDKASLTQACTNMSSNIPTPKAGEADPCCVITFVVLPQQEGSIPIEIDCVTTHVIGGLKEDCTDLFGIPAEQQVWTYNGQILEDDSTLRSYGIDPSSNTEIIVKSSA